MPEEYSRKFRKIAVSCVLDWKQNGMKRDVFDELQLSSPNVILVYCLVPSETSDTISKIPIEGRTKIILVILNIVTLKYFYRQLLSTTI